MSDVEAKSGAFRFIFISIVLKYLMKSVKNFVYVSFRNAYACICNGYF